MLEQRRMTGRRDVGEKSLFLCGILRWVVRDGVPHHVRYVDSASVVEQHWLEVCGMGLSWLHVAEKNRLCLAHGKADDGAVADQAEPG